MRPRFHGWTHASFKLTHQAQQTKKTQRLTVSPTHNFASFQKPAGKRRSTWGASAVIAALLLVAVTVAASMLLYVYTMGLIAQLQVIGGQQLRQQLTMRGYDWSGCCPESLKLYIRNSGPVNAVIAAVYVNGIPASYNLGGCGNTVNVGATCTLTLTLINLPITLGVSYVVKIVTADGAIFTYSAVAGQKA